MKKIIKVWDIIKLRCTNFRKNAHTMHNIQPNESPPREGYAKILLDNHRPHTKDRSPTSWLKR